MASIKNLKKEFKYVLGDLIDAIFIWEISIGKETEQSLAVKTEIFEKYEAYLSKVNKKGVEQRGKYIHSVRNEFRTDAENLVEKINNLS